ncbi:MAG: antibiotic biosynthesis monooxygenase [Proteobacteria bacterium]|nr:antibiotic biosynthesis monooxygenase [Pseudomonadota bacterium]MBU4471392.1 antibiotic biosynthesis monooxygenase [Pseudomonadota bacterium]MCG2752397.1 antibiotic biosynthesis monooxygenase [Desulfobacteraceae bacterium]
MSVKILIKREVPESKQKDLNELLKEMRTFCTQQPGYISGETLERADHPGEFLVISTWQSVDDWRKWVISQERQEVQDKIDELLGVETRYEIYTYH